RQREDEWHVATHAGGLLAQGRPFRTASPVPGNLPLSCRAMALPTQTDDFPAWYQEVVKQAGLAENSLVRGAMVIKPYGFGIWEAIQREVDDRIKATGHQNLYFPMLIPSRLLEKEAEHVEGFAPEVAVVTHAGGED